VDENVDPAKLRGLCSVFPHLEFGSPVGVGWVGPGLRVGSAGLLVHALGKYLDPVKKQSVWPSEPGTLDTKISWNHPRGLSAQGVTSDLATCSPVKDVLAQGILDKTYHWGLRLGVD